MDEDRIEALQLIQLNMCCLSGVWFWHCHLERHLSWGMNTVFIVKDGGTEETRLRPPPPNMPSCLNTTTLLSGGSGQNGVLEIVNI